MTDYTRTQILLEKEQHEQLKEIAAREGLSFSELVRNYLDRQIRLHAYEQMQTAARILREEYLNDKELSNLTDLDGEDFLNE